MKTMLLVAMMVAAGCGGQTNNQNVVSGPKADSLETAFTTAWESIGGMERESRPRITWVESVDCDSLASTETANGGTPDHFCNGAWIDGSGNALLPWTGKISHDPGFPVVLAAYRNWLRYSSFKTHTDEQAAFDQSFAEGLTSIGL